MKVVLIGATGTIGKAIARDLQANHEVVLVSRSSGDYQVDISSKESIRRLCVRLTPFDAIVCAAGQARFGAIDVLTDDDFQFSLSNKLMGQVNLVRVGLAYISDRGSFTLTSGVLASEPIPGSTAISLVNAGVEAFSRAAALEMPRGIRINVVSPPWVSETLVAMGRNGTEGMSAALVAAAYVESVEGLETGKVIDPRTFAA